MSRVFTDQNLLNWEAYVSGGKFGLPENPNIIFNCLSDQDRRARFIVHAGGEASAEDEVEGMSIARLREMLASSRELD